jgi:hypothetical protein
MNSLAALLLASAVFAQPILAADPPTKVLDGTVAQTGLLKVNIDRKGGRILATLPASDNEGVSGRFIYTAALETGLGSPALGLDYALNSGSRLLAFRRIGKKVVAEIENPRFRASGASAQELAGVRRSFATSTIWMGDVAADNADGSFVIDLASFIARDDLGIAKALKEQDSADYRLAPELSVADPAGVHVFPKNVELEARLTFTTARAGPEVENIAPVSGNVTFLVRHSLIALPEAGYVPRRFDPRAGSFGSQVVDFNAPLGSQVVYELANRFRLEKTDPNAARSPVKKPIIFYIDPAAPEPIRNALVEGVAWWRDAFDAAGLVDAFRAEVLPAGADPLDIRYNVVNWVNRATRGWSYGQPITDPRTGEIVKGQVLLGSLRVRQDIMIYQALVGAGLTGTGDPNDPVTAALARIRQLGAHEVGHALGFAHNFAASIGGRQSVMDYPAPRVKLTDGRLDLTDAYGVGVGDWDKFAVAWLYGAATDATAQPVMAAGIAQGLRYVPDQDSRAPDSAHPLGSLWDDGSDPVAELKRVMEVRQVAVQRFGPAALKAGDPQYQLRRAFVPVWLLHRYQVEAAAKLLGGVDFSYATVGDGTGTAKAVSADRQRAALDALLDTLSPAALTVPAAIMPNLSAGWSGDGDRQTEIEAMRTAGGPVFDPLSATETAVAMTLSDLLAPNRLNRLEIQNQADPATPSAHEAIDRLIDRTFAQAGDAGVQRRVATTVALALARTQRDGALSPTIALTLSERMNRLGTGLAATKGNSVQADWSRGLGRLLLDRDALTAALADQRRLPKVPPGMPIGSD